MASPTLRELTGMNPNFSPISSSALVLIDCQQTYREGIMQLVGVEPALQEAAELLRRFRAAGRPVIHIMHDAGPGTPYDVSAPIGQIAESVAPIEYNYRTQAEFEARGEGFDSEKSMELPGRSCFLRVDGRIFHTYSQYARGLESTGGSYVFSAAMFATETRVIVRPVTRP